MEILRLLHSVEVEHNFLLSVEHIPGRRNTRADALSREHFALFRDEHLRATGSMPSSTATRITFPRRAPAWLTT